MINEYLKLATQSIESGEYAIAVRYMHMACEQAAKERSSKFGMCIIALNKTRALWAVKG